ncbi:molybdenum cofactor guanylyltransferase MobA [Paracoccus salipaludis]|uniref:Molybdenum cofactor guanylyltransferase n=1 Tax=Paracoccus salipaludis TaxID=2032623 RepID=A0A2A2GIG6_9RHOB|nr:molybdenum cofactor guanylyltransferase MobA [Paracoccus salipaludis]PAU97406.1 molybdenum cofactor guanylyltransferase MobA [Paracoccus salipaludis]
MGGEIAGIVLAGGQSRRMGGGDKGLLDLGGRPVIAHVIERLGCARAISANGDPARFARFGLPVLPDSVPDWPGPLAGVLAGMDWAAGQGIARILTAAADTPFFPRDLGTRLAAAKAPVVMATGGGDHPAFAMWDVALRDDLRAALHSGTRRMRNWMDARGALRVEIPGEDPFFNINTPADLDAARRRLAEGPQWT